MPPATSPAPARCLGAAGTVEKPFCLPIGNAHDARPALCDLPTPLHPEPRAGQHLPGAPSYEFWIFDPHGTYNRLLTLSTPQFTPANLQSVPVPVNVDLNIRVRPMVNGSFLEYGPACRYRFKPNVAHRDERSMMFDDSGVTMSLYPNPNRGTTVYLNMEGLATEETPVDITTHDALGQQVHAERTAEGRWQA